MHILIVDDRRDTADSLAMVLTLTGYSTGVAYNGLAALDAARRRRPDVVVLDLGMPVMNGYEVARRLREMYGQTMLVIAVTGFGREEDRKRSLESGVTMHLVKPVEPVQLTKLIEGGLAVCS